MARPLREQLAIAMLAVLVPVGVVMTWSVGRTYREQLVNLNHEAQALAKAAAAHIERAASNENRFDDFARAFPLPEGGSIAVTDAAGSVLTQHNRTRADEEPELTYGNANVRNRGLTVAVGLPTALAWDRAKPIYQRTIAISGLATGILLVLQVAFLRRWLPSLARLERHADRVGHGDLSALPRDPMPSRELDRLRDAFREMVDKLRAARDAIARQVDEERRMRQEVESLQKQIIRQERLAAIGILLSGIAHELNNPLQAISGLSEVLQRDPELTPEVRSDLAVIQKESARASAIIRNLSRFSRQQGVRPGTVYLADVIDSVMELRKRALHEKNIALEIDDSADRSVTAVFTELQQVLLNFVINAEQALASSNGSRRITVRTKSRDGRVRLEVEDTGPGVAPENESRLFQPFFTTKPVGEGTGLGLSVSYGIIQSTGGSIGYERSASRGAIFYFELPGDE